MPLVPEKLQNRQEVRQAISSQFWDQPLQSTISQDGLAKTLPCEPPPLSQTGYSGLFRPQELLVTQALGLPAMPGYSQQDGGLVLDRVVGRVGGPKWWSTLSLRAKAQRMHHSRRQGAPVKDIVKDLNNYGLSSRSRLQLTRHTTVHGLLEAPNVAAFKQHVGRSHRGGRLHTPQLLRRVTRGRRGAAAQAAAVEEGGANGHNSTPQPAAVEAEADEADPGVGEHQTASDSVQGSAGAAPAPSAAPSGEGAPYRAALWAKQTLPGHDLTANASWNAASLDSSASYCQVPLTLALDLSSKDRPDGIQYRVGLHQTSAPEIEASSRSQGMAAKANTDWRTSLHVQGAVAVEGEAHLWRPGRGGPPLPTSAAHMGHSASDAAAQLAAEGQMELDGMAAPAAGSRAQAQPGHQAEGDDTGAVAAAGTQLPVRVWSRDGDAGGQATSGYEPSFEVSAAECSPTTGGQAAAHQQSKRVVTLSDLPVLGAGDAEAFNQADFDEVSIPESGGEGLGPSEQAHRLPMLGNVTAGSIQKSIADAQVRLQQARGAIQGAQRQVQEGMLQRQEAAAQQRLQRVRRLRAYSPLLAQPHLKINAAVGCLGRMPLPRQAFKPLRRTQPSSPLSSNGDLPEQGAPAGAEDTLSRRFGAELWAPYLRDTALRVFASVGLSGQVGRFTRPALDYTAGSVRLDLGLTSPHQVGTLAGTSSYGNLAVFNPRHDSLEGGAAAYANPPGSTRSFKSRAFALEGRGIWHALSASVAQQLIGPVRIRADFRFALDLPSSIPQDEEGRRGWKSIGSAAASVRPSLLEAVYGADMVIPGSQGVARAAVWVSPVRREAMAQIKLF